MSASALSHRNDPIAAIATAAGRGAVGIVRISGHGLAPLVRALLGRDLRPRHATWLPFADDDGSPIDRGLALWFPAPHSYTGQDVLELHAHGGNVVLHLLLARCLRAAGALPGLERMRLAQPGEFTQRAFLNGKIDLAQAEAVADLIDAGSAAAARSASASLCGAFSQQAKALAHALLHLRTHIEATLDFPEEDIDLVRAADCEGQLGAIRTQLQRVRAAAHQGALLREGMRVVIAGLPNAGKSSLLNALAGDDLAIVSAQAGTTRDRLRQTIAIDGVPIHITDTAGLRASSDEVEQIGVARAWQAVAQADAVLCVHDLARAHDAHYQQATCAMLRQMADQRPAAVPLLHIANKSDAVSDDGALRALQALCTEEADWLCLSARTGQGLDALREALLKLAGWQAAPEGVFLARSRHLRALEQAEAHLQQAAAQLASPAPALELLAEDLRLAHDALAALTGAVGADEVLGEIFASFCMGK